MGITKIPVQIKKYGGSVIIRINPKVLANAGFKIEDWVLLTIEKSEEVQVQ